MPPGSSLAIEDLVSLHITGDSLYNQVAGALANGFQVQLQPIIACPA